MIRMNRARRRFTQSTAAAAFRIAVQLVDAVSGAHLWADRFDGSLEAMERPGPRFCLAVQWHPEDTAAPSTAVPVKPELKPAPVAE